MKATYRLTRDVPVEGGYDLVVAGGGPGGMAAAICAARLGARVLLVEATGCLGGMGTSGLVTAFDPMSDGERMLVGGLMREIVYTLFERGELGPDITEEQFTKRYMSWTQFNVEAYKFLLDELVQQAGVEVRFFTRLIDVESDTQERSVKGVILHNVEGYRYIEAKTFVDATGDAILADLAGAECKEAGRDTPRIMPASLTSLLSDIDWEQCTWRVQQEALKVALEDGHFTQYDRHLPGMSRVQENIGYLNGGHLYNLNALRSQSLSEGVMLGRRIAREYVEFYRKYVPGCERIQHVTTASLIGVRESRRIVGEAELTVDDYLGRRQFKDQIGVFNKFIDIHPYDTSEAEFKRLLKEKDDPRMKLLPGECFGIPYGILVPRGWRNLWVAGRAASADVQAHGVIRVQPAAAMMGQAVGTAAVQAINSNCAANEIDRPQLIRDLRKQGAYLPQQGV